MAAPPLALLILPRMACCSACPLDGLQASAVASPPEGSCLLCAGHHPPHPFPHPPPPPCRAQAALFAQEQRSRKRAGDKFRVDFEGVVVTVGAAAS